MVRTIPRPLDLGRLRLEDGARLDVGSRLFESLRCEEDVVKVCEGAIVST